MVDRDVCMQIGLPPWKDAFLQLKTAISKGGGGLPAGSEGQNEALSSYGLKWVPRAPMDQGS